MRIKIAKWGNSAAIRLPKAMLELMQVGEGSELELVMEGDRLVVSRANPARHATLDELVLAMNRLGGTEYDYGQEEWATLPSEIIERKGFNDGD
ncbi:MAG: AbrB/MazE/SpoVT family DNA-binding domain-containing protein [Hyphomicrobiales bacterium]|nr:AbrB/MazE/SpoVT family DNA-binding domain-containing protein [Hyphomicrobiales bacterium]